LNFRGGYRCDGGAGNGWATGRGDGGADGGDGCGGGGGGGGGADGDDSGAGGDDFGGSGAGANGGFGNAVVHERGIDTVGVETAPGGRLDRFESDRHLLRQVDDTATIASHHFRYRLERFVVVLRDSGHLDGVVF